MEPLTEALKIEQERAGKPNEVGFPVYLLIYNDKTLAYFNRQRRDDDAHVLWYSNIKYECKTVYVKDAKEISYKL